MQYEPVETDLPVQQFIPESDDRMALKRLVKVLNDEEFVPDVIYATGDTGSLTVFMQFIPARFPFVAYNIIEGEPIVSLNWRKCIAHRDTFTASQYGADVARAVLDRDMDWVYHGVDHNVFYPDAGRREKVREALGWTDKFVVMTVAQNVRRKQHPRLFEAMSILKHDKHQKDIILYDHTVPLQSHFLDGWNLHEIAAGYAVNDVVAFNADMDNGFGSHIAETSTSGIGLADYYRAADLFVLVSQVEGFGLPIAEAMASGLPVAVTKYAAGWEIANLGQGYGFPVKHWEVHKSGTRYANLEPRDIADGILRLKRDPKRLARMSEAGIEAAKQFDWNMFKEKVVSACEASQSNVSTLPLVDEEEEARGPAGQGTQQDTGAERHLLQVEGADCQEEAGIQEHQGSSVSDTDTAPTSDADVDAQEETT